jgi:hypothetical protein
MVWYMDKLKTNKGTGAMIYRWGSRSRHISSLRLHIFQAEVYVNKEFVMENTE